MEYTEEYIEKNADKFDWQNISIFQKLSEALIEKYADMFRRVWRNCGQILLK